MRKRLSATLAAIGIAVTGFTAADIAVNAPPALAYADFVYNTDSPSTNHGVFFTDANGIERIMYAGQGSYTTYRISQVTRFRLKSTTCAFVTVRPITGGTTTEYVPKGGGRNVRDGMSIDIDPRTSPC